MPAVVEQLPPDRPEVEWIGAAEVPVVDWAAWSKNRTWRQNAVGRGPPVRLSPAAVRARRDLSRLVRASLRRWPRHDRLWVAVDVVRGDLRGDPANCLDGVLDAVRDAVGRDDRHFAVWSLSWSLDPRDARLRVWVGEQLGPAGGLTCSRCGLLLPPDEFGRRRGSRTGRAARCRKCEAEVRLGHRTKAK